MGCANIKRRDLWKRLNNLKHKDWKRAGDRLGLYIDKKGGNGSHFLLADVNYSSGDKRYMVTTVPRALHKKMNEMIFEQLIERGFAEDEIWRALRLL